MSGYVLNISNKGIRYMLNSMGPSTDPWGTPWVIIRGGDECFLILTEERREEMYEVNQLRAVPFIPIMDNLCSRILWSSVSKAADISNSVRMVPRLVFSLDSISEVINVRADSVDLWGR